jgi:hypothetical protein
MPTFRAYERGFCDGIAAWRGLISLLFLVKHHSKHLDQIHHRLINDPGESFLDRNHIPCIISWTMVRPEYNRLRQHDEASLRRWAQIVLLPEAPISAPARLAAEVKQRALLE